MKILLVEPDRILGRNYRQALKQANHDVQLANGAQAALLALDEKIPDLIILELQMPSHNGVEFLYEIRSYPEWQGIPVVILSLAPKETVIADTGLFNRLGVRDYLYKPQTKLVQLVRLVSRMPEASNV